MRTPLLPLRVFTSWTDAVTRSQDEPGEVLRRELAAVLERPLVREAVFVATPDLDGTIDAWRQDPLTDKGRRTERALVRYFARMCSRPTPFGLFAGCSLGTVDTAAATAVKLEDSEANGRATRLDMEYVAALVVALERAPELRARLTYRPNNSIYRAAGRVRYIEAVLADRARQHRLVAVDDSDYLSDTLDRAAGGATRDMLAAALVTAEITQDDAVAFVEELVDTQLLVSELEPAITGGDPLAGLAASLRALQLDGDQGAIAGVLENVSARLADLDQAHDGSRESYREIATVLASLPTEPKLPRLFQVDMIKPVREAVLGGSVVAELERAVRVLHTLMPAPADSALDRFRARFQERYEDRQVPLVEALDEELGIGFDASTAPSAEASPLLRDLAFPAGAGDLKIAWTATASMMTRKVMSALRAGHREVDITAAEVEKLALGTRSPLPDALAVTASIAAASPEALAGGDFKVLVHAVVGPSGARMLGRFCHADRGLEQAVREHLAAEEAARPDVVFAEIVHLPEGRIGNITMRPVLRGYEIPYLGRSAAGEDALLPVSDLVVTVRGDEVVLSSRRLGRRIIPRLSSAHNYAARSVGIYRFLCSLQGQGVHGQLAWDWGMLSSAAHLPRVTSGRLVLARERWRIDGTQVKALQADSEAGRHQALRALAAAIGLPRLFLLSDADNELLTDLENPLSAETFVQLVARRQDAVLHELFPAPDELWVEGPEGRFVSEVIVPFQAAPVADAAAPAGASRAVATPPRVRFAPGSEWLYLKLYTGTATADAVLRDLVAPLVREERRRGAIDRWFFLRYGDPDWHLRVRLHGDPAALGEVMLRAHAAAQPLLDDGRLHRVVVDTYEPEVARYGGLNAIGLAEGLFEVDSDAVLSIVELLSGDEGMDARWRLALRGADMIPDDLGLQLGQKRALARRLRDSYRREFEADSRFNGQVGDRYRKESRGLRDLLLRSADAGSPLLPGFQLLDQRSASGRPLIARVRELDASEGLAVSLSDLGASLVHMHVNRLLRSAHRAQELVLYDFLDRLYMSFSERA